MNSTEHWRRIESLFHQAIEIAPDERAHWLEERCENDEHLRRKVEELLAADSGLSSTWPGLNLEPEPNEIPKIPGYEDLELLGRGGMGSVYLARRHDQLFEGKPFAIKVLHAFRTSKQGKRRFETERRLLADLDHPNIVRLYDGGELADGRPYLIMDYVDGRPLDRYCREERLTVRERLRLFQKICRALHYAHQNLVVHRDLKPSNILVDDERIPHLLDFGIAKRLNGSDGGLLATTEWRPMTPAYASPEQIAGASITTASDLYSLGLVLFELLTDRLPNSSRPSSLPEPSDPPKLDSVVTDSAQAEARRTTTPRLRRSLQGDLDQIVGKALRLEPESRYASAREFGEDVERHLNDLPVLARRGSWRYLFGRFLKRHRLGVALAGSALLALTLASMVGVQSKRLSEVEASEAEKERLVRRLVGPETDVLMREGSLDQVVARILELDVSEDSKSILLDGVRRLHLSDDRLFDQVATLLREQENLDPDPDLARVTLLIGELLLHRGQYEDAEEIMAGSMRLTEIVHGRDSPELVPYLELHASALAELERYPEGIAALRHSILLRQSIEAMDMDLAHPMAHLAGLLYLQGAFHEAVAANRKALAILDWHGGGSPSARAGILSSLSVALADLRDSEYHEEAELYAREALDLDIQTHGPEHMRALRTRHNLVMVLTRSGKRVQALDLSLKNLEAAERILGPDHSRVGYLQTGVATLYAQLGQPEDCVVYARKAVSLREETLPADSFLTAVSKTRLASCLADLGQGTEAIGLLQSSIDTLKRTSVQDRHWLEMAQSRLEDLTSERQERPKTRNH